MAEVRIKLTSAKVDFEVEVELGKMRCCYWVCFALSFSGPESYFFGQVGGVGGWLEKVKIKLNST